MKSVDRYTSRIGGEASTKSKGGDTGTDEVKEKKGGKTCQHWLNFVREDE